MILPTLPLTNIASLYQYFDDLVTQDAGSDTLFASSYIRAFVSLAASEFVIAGEKITEQRITAPLLINITKQLELAKGELSVADNDIVEQYWQRVQNFFPRATSS